MLKIKIGFFGKIQQLKIQQKNKNTETKHKK